MSSTQAHGSAMLGLILLTLGISSSFSIAVESAKLTGSDIPTFGFKDFGASVAVSGDVVLVGSDREGGYVYRWNGSSWVETKLNLSVGAYSGIEHPVAISGNIAVVGDSFVDAQKGSAYVFRHNGSDWIQEQKLTASDGAAADFFGDSNGRNFEIRGAGGAGDGGGSGGGRGRKWCCAGRFSGSHAVDQARMPRISAFFAVVGRNRTFSHD